MRPCPACVPQSFVQRFVELCEQPQTFQTLEELEALGVAICNRTSLTEIAQSIYGRLRSRPNDKRQRDREGSKLSMYAKRKIDAWQKRLGLELCEYHRVERLRRTGGYGDQGSRSNRPQRLRRKEGLTAYEVALESTPTPQAAAFSPEFFVDKLEQQLDPETIAKIAEELRRRGYIMVTRKKVSP